MAQSAGPLAAALPSSSSAAAEGLPYRSVAVLVSGPSASSEPGAQAFASAAGRPCIQRVQGGQPLRGLGRPMMLQAPRLSSTLPQVQHLHLPVEGWKLIKRTTSSVWERVRPPEPEKTFHCPFCLENVRQSERVVFAACGKEADGVCRECCGHYIRGLVADGRVQRIGCHRCLALASPAEILELTDAATFKKYERFKQMQQDHTVRECPACFRLCKPTLDEDGNPDAEMHCPDCKTAFCFYHSNAHTGQPCAEYRKQVAREEKITEQGLRGTKACPVCGVRTEKTGGCNHMTCQRCGSDWCWVCNEKLDDVTAHYYFGGPLACGQFDDVESRTPMSFAIKCITVPLQVVSVIFFILLTLTALIWFPVVYLLHLPCYYNTWGTCQMTSAPFKCILICSVILAYLPFVVFQLLWTICAALFWFLLRIFGAERRHLYNLVRAPVLAVLPVLIGIQIIIDSMPRVDADAQIWPREWEMYRADLESQNPASEDDEEDLSSASSDAERSSLVSSSSSDTSDPGR